MKVAIDISPLTSGNYLQHRVRGTGYYLQNLKSNLVKLFPETTFKFISRNEKIDLSNYLLHIPYFEPFFFTLPKIKRLKTVVTVHDLTPLVFKEKFPAGLKGSLKWRIQKELLRKSDRIITDSNSSKKDIIKYLNYPENKIDVVYLAASESFRIISDKKILDQIKNKYNLPDEFLLYVGDATWNKNLPGLLSAINKTNFHLVIVGKAFKNREYDRNNPWNKDLAEAQELSENNEKIIELGFVEDNDLPSIYNLATVFIMPSFYEGFGLPVLEALQCGTPVIASDKGSIPEVGGDAVLYVDPNDKNSIIDAINKLMNDLASRNKMSLLGIKQAKKFSWENTARETHSSYQKVLNP